MATRERGSCVENALPLQSFVAAVLPGDDRVQHGLFHGHGKVTDDLRELAEHAPLGYSSAGGYRLRTVPDGAGRGEPRGRRPHAAGQPGSQPPPGERIVIAISTADVNSTVYAARPARAHDRPHRGRDRRRPRVGARPVRAATAAPDRGHRRGDRGRRPLPAGRRRRAGHRGRPPGRVAERDARPDRARLRGAAGVGEPPAPLRRRRRARAANAAHVGARVCRAVPPRRIRAARRTWR